MSDGVTAVEEAGAGRYCIGCGYNLRGLLSDRCPECGLPIDTAEGSAIPWEGRKEIGNIRAFRRTCWEAMFHPRRLARAVGFPVNSGYSRGFRLLVAVLASFPVGIAVTIISVVEGWSAFFNYLMWPGLLSQPQMVIGSLPFGWEIAAIWMAGVTTWGVLPLEILITIYLWTGILGLWVRPRHWPVERRNRATAVGAYVCAPLSLMIFPAVSLLIAYLLSNASGQQFDWIIGICIVLGFVVLVAIIVSYFVSSLRFISATTHCGWGRWVAAYVGLPVCWVLSAVIGLGLLPMLLGLIRIMIQSVFS
jgi:hypothetical protein